MRAKIVKYDVVKMMSLQTETTCWEGMISQQAHRDISPSTFHIHYRVICKTSDPGGQVFAVS